jgi:hypothetical protein
MKGTILAEFAGTRDEARAYARENGIGYAQNKGLSVNGLPIISIPFKSSAEYANAIARFEALGWDRDSILSTDLRMKRR